MSLFYVNKTMYGFTSTTLLVHVLHKLSLHSIELPTMRVVVLLINVVYYTNTSTLLWYTSRRGSEEVRSVCGID